MQTPRVNWNPPLTRHLVETGLFRDPPFCLVDVGVSGGIDRYWEVFRNSLRSFGFDGLIKEIERLNATTTGLDRHHYAYLVGDKSYQPPQGVADTRSFARTSAWRAIEIANVNHVAKNYDPTGTGQSTTEMIELDQFFLRDHPENVDFIKVDTDESDYQVLRGAKELLSSRVLGVAVEVQFQGLVHDESNTFRNVDRLLTSLGFSLFDLQVYRYSRAALPKTFIYRHTGMTQGGQVSWGDALYLRDLGNRDYERTWAMTFPPLKIIKLVCICEIFGLEDCAAELLLKYRADVANLIDADVCLDMLTPQVGDQKRSYLSYKDSFELDPTSFYPVK